MNFGRTELLLFFLFFFFFWQRSHIDPSNAHRNGTSNERLRVAAAFDVNEIEIESSPFRCLTGEA
jgi:hypothetical protein